MVNPRAGTAKRFPRPAGALALVAYAAIVGIATIAATGASFRFAYAAWQGTVEVRDGVAHVLNPANPEAGRSTITPNELWRHGGDEDEDSDVLFGVIASVALDASGTAYLLDTQQSQIYVYDSSGEYISTIGREGEGPGEFRHASQLFVDSGGDIAVLQMMPGKIVRISPDGDPLEGFPLPHGEGGGRLFLAGGEWADGGVVLSTNSFARSKDGMSITRELLRVGPEGNREATYLTQEMSRNFASMVFDETKNAQPLFAVDARGRVYIHTRFDAYAVDVYARDGKHERVIERKYEHRKRSAEEMEANKPRVRMRRNRKLSQPKTNVSETDRDVFALYARPGGTLWALSSRGARDGDADVLATFDEFDADGHFVRQVAIRAEGAFGEDGIVLKGNRLFVIRGMRSAQRAMFGAIPGGAEEEEEDDTTPLEVICYDLSGSERAEK